MRYIDVNEVVLPDGWAERAEEARAAVEGFDAADRPAEINGRSSVWGALKQRLANLTTHEKCWYCETPRVRDDYAVDHYRPKSAKNNDDHDGYWWLAFDHHNFRFSCKYCNEIRRDRETDQTGGKGSAFPLLEGGVRARTPEDSLNDERCILLDPTCNGDPELLGFAEDGTALPQADPELEPDDYIRADESIPLLNLNHSWLRKRRAVLASIVTRHVAEAQIEFEKCLKRKQEGVFPAVADAAQRFQDAKNELTRLKNQEAEYSALVIAVLKSKRCPERPWIDRLFQ